MMEKEHGGACADLVGHASRAIRAAGELFVVSGTHRPYLSDSTPNNLSFARIASAKPAGARFWGRLTNSHGGQENLPAFDTVTLSRSSRSPQLCSPLF
jgi:hypothetical protein